MTAFVRTRHVSLLACLAALLFFDGVAAHAAGGKWTFTGGPDSDNAAMMYQEDGKTVFDLGVGRAIVLWIAYPGPRQPGPPKSDGEILPLHEETIKIHTATDVFVMKGKLMNDVPNEPGFDPNTTYFEQDDLGVDRGSTEFEAQAFERVLQRRPSGRSVERSRSGVVAMTQIDLCGLVARVGPMTAVS